MLDFIGIGAQKAGTTWLYANLKKHPELSFPAGKEVHFWDWHYAHGLDWYKNLFSKNDDSIKNGDITPAYAFIDSNKIKECHEYAPDARIIYCIRNPIDRAWSAARMMLNRCELTLEEASDQWFIDLFKSHGSRIRGDYVYAIDNWTSVYKREQVLVVHFDHIVEKPDILLFKCCEHLGIDPTFFTKQQENIIREKIHASGSHSVPIRPSLLPVLHDIYDTHIQAMEKHPVLLEAWG